MSRPYSRVIEAVAAIATKLGATVTPTGNRLADNLDGIANVVTPGGGGGGGGGGIVTPTYTSTYNETTEDYDISCDMEFSAIEAAVQAGACVGAYFVRADESGYVEFYPLSASISGQVLIFMKSEPMDNPEMEFTGLSIFRTIVHQSTGDIIQKDQIPQS